MDIYTERLLRIKTDPWYFLSNCVFTLDQVDKANPIKRFPSEGTMGQYLKLYTRVWHRFPRTAVPKSRRMFMTWVNVGLYLWDTMFNIGRHNALLSKKEEDANELIKKAKFIADHIPEDFLPRDLIPRYDVTYCKMEFKDINSLMSGFPQGEDQLRQHTISGILMDEMAFWEKAQATYSASIPCTEGGGRVTCLSSPGPGFFKQIVFDQLDEVPRVAATEQVDRFPLPGVEVWLNKKNRFFVFQLHYSANAKKRDPLYREEIKASMPIRQYMQEYELQWESYEGTPVYPDFSRQLHGSKARLSPDAGLPLLRGWDFGLTPACIVCQYVDGQLRVLREFVSANKGAEQFVGEVMQECSVMYPHWGDRKKDWRDYADPAGNQRKDTDMRTCIQIMTIKYGLTVLPGPVAWEKRRSAVEGFLTKVNKSKPSMLVDLNSCPTLVRGFEGGYRYPEKSLEVEPTKIRPIKDEHSHVHDAFQYVCHGVNAILNKQVRVIPQPKYNWNHGEEYADKPRRQAVAV